MNPAVTSDLDGSPDASRDLTRPERAQLSLDGTAAAPTADTAHAADGPAPMNSAPDRPKPAGALEALSGDAAEPGRPTPGRRLGWAPGERLRNPRPGGTVAARAEPPSPALEATDALPSTLESVAGTGKDASGATIQSGALPRDSLAQAQEAACGQSSFVGGFICRERARMRFCDKRWNQHPDCQVSGPAREP